MFVIYLAVAISLTSPSSSSVLPRGRSGRPGLVRPADLPFKVREASKFNDAPDRRFTPSLYITSESEEKPTKKRKPFSYQVVDLDNKKLDQLYKLIGLKRKHKTKVLKEKRVQKTSNDRLQGLNKYFDKNGMYFITKPTATAEDRELNYLLTKAIQNNVLNNNILEDDNTLRNPPLFTRKEINKLKQISRALQEPEEVNSLEGPESPDTPKIEFRFDELVA